MIRNFKPNTFLLCLLGIFVCQESFSQTIINGATVSSSANSIIKINNHSLTLDNNALFQQNGLIQIDNDLLINSGKKEIDGTVQVQGNYS